MAPIIETAFGIIFVFLIFSLVTSWIVEYIAMRFQRRGKVLYKYLTDSLNDSFNKNWGLMLYDHPLIEVLGREIRRPRGFLRIFYNNRLGVKRRLPFYISSDQMATALIDIIINHEKDVYFRVSEINGSQELVKEEGIDQSSYTLFIESLNNLKESEIKRTLVALTRNISETSPDKFLELKQQLIQWYDNGMDRLTGWYKRDTRWRLFLVGMIVTVFFNVNSLTVVDRMYVDPQLRESVNNAAITFMQEYEQLPTNQSDTTVAQLNEKINELHSRLTPLDLPIGWKNANEPADYFTAVPKNIFGWLLTAIGLSFGAPFWFDILKKFVNMRSSGISPKK